MQAGYSGTPLARKLGIKPGFHLWLYHPPSDYFHLFSDLPEDLVVIENPQPATLDFIHAFCRTQKELFGLANNFKEALKKTGMLWVSWPKGSSSIPTDLKRDMIRESLLALGLVDVKVAAINDDWSGLKFVYRLKDR
ncbi:MAG: DUF3052 domain-containing protein [Lewinellaceae bacterium]|nr:DUF3052 domain-containing protein [Lewinellaceae bacterium]